MTFNYINLFIEAYSSVTHSEANSRLIGALLSLWDQWRIRERFLQCWLLVSMQLTFAQLLRSIILFYLWKATQASLNRKRTQGWLAHYDSCGTSEEFVNTLDRVACWFRFNLLLHNSSAATGGRVSIILFYLWKATQASLNRKRTQGWLAHYDSCGTSEEFVNTLDRVACWFRFNLLLHNSSAATGGRVSIILFYSSKPTQALLNRKRTQCWLAHYDSCGTLEESVNTLDRFACWFRFCWRHHNSL